MISAVNKVTNMDFTGWSVWLLIWSAHDEVLMMAAIGVVTFVALFFFLLRGSSQMTEQLVLSQSLCLGLTDSATGRLKLFSDLRDHWLHFLLNSNH